MRQLQKIIVGHDLAAGGEMALRAAATFALHSGAAIRLVHVVEPYHWYQTMSHPLTASFTLEELAQHAGEKLAALSASSTLTGIRIDYEVHIGKAFVELLIASRGWQADLIVVGGTTQRQDVLIGSCAERIVRKAATPVFVAKRPFTTAATRFLVPTDFSVCARKAAEEALALAERFGGHICFCHVLDLASLYPPMAEMDIGAIPPLPFPTPEDFAGEWRTFLAELPTLSRVSWEQQVVEGRAATTILRQAEEQHADMIVIGTHGRTGVAHMLLGSVAEEVVRMAPCPVLTIRPDAFQFTLP